MVETIINDVFRFLVKFFRTVVFSLLKVKLLIEKLKNKNTADLINSFPFLIISFFLFFPIVSSYANYKSLSRDYPLIVSKGLIDFYSNYNLFEKFFIICPLFFLCELLMLFIMTIELVPKIYKDLYRSLYRYFTGGMLFLFSVLSLLFQLTTFGADRLIEDKRAVSAGNIVVGIIVISLGILFLAPPVMLFIKLYKDKPLKKSGFINIPFASFISIVVLMIVYDGIYNTYNLYVNPAKVHVSSLLDPYDLEIDVYKDTVSKQALTIPPDSTKYIIKSPVVFTNNSDKEYILDTNTAIDCLYYKETSNYDNDSSYLNLRILKSDFNSENYIYLKPKEVKVVNFISRISYRKYHFIKRYYGYYNIRCAMLPLDDDLTGQINQDLNLFVYSPDKIEKTK